MVADVVTQGLDAHLIVRRPDGFGLDVRLAIPNGETVALLGPNGAGKSTVVAALAGLVPLDGGCIALAGQVFDDPQAGRFVQAQERDVGVVFQDYLLFPNLSARDNVSFGLRNSGMSRRAARVRADEWLGRFGMKAMGDRRPHHLSGGQRQRVALARALAPGPAMLLLDEPLAALDAGTRADVRRTLVDELDGFAGPRLLITHDPAEAFLVADQVHIIEDGSVTQVGTGDDIRLRPRTQYAADLAGSNLLVGIASEGVVATDTHTISIADASAEGPVLVTIHPRAISLHLLEPEGSPRNTWKTAVSRVEHYGDRVRVRLSAPEPLTAEITPAGLGALAVGEGDEVWVSIKATEIAVEAR